MTRREIVLIAAVVIVGYLLYIPIFTGATAVFADQSINENPPDNQLSSANLSQSNPVQEDNVRNRSIQFREVAVKHGIEYTPTVDYGGANAMISNAGVYAVDFNNDRYEDVLLIGGKQPILYENTGGAFRKSRALPEVNRTVRSALFFDYDNDGWDDLLLLSNDKQALLLENQNGTFAVVEVGFNREFEAPIGATAADYTGNGCPDLFVIQYGDWTEEHPAGERDYNVPPGEDNGNPNHLFVGNCTSFKEVTNESGIQGTKWSLATSFVDVNDDGRPDIHVANDFNHDILYLNNGSGFEQVYLGNRTNRNGMSSEVVDINGDGYVDIFVTNIYFPRQVTEKMETTMEFRATGNNLLVNQRNGSFEDQAAEYGVEEGGWGWSAEVIDFDNDGRRDLFHTTRYMSFKYSDKRFSQREIEQIHSRHSFYRYPALYKRTEVQEFERRSPAASGFSKSDGRGVITLDFNRDGNVDLLVANADGNYQLYENTADSGSSLRIDVRGNKNITALGSTVSIVTENKTQTRIYNSQSDFLSQSSRKLHFGFENTTTVDVIVTWPDGTRQVFEDIKPDQLIIVSPDGIEEKVDIGE